jgi:hypothetical protein
MEVISRNLQNILELVMKTVDERNRDKAVTMYEMLREELRRIKSIEFTPAEEEEVWNNYKQVVKMCYAILGEQIRRQTIQEMSTEEWAKHLPMG